jgi:hypothetical protein
MRRFLLSKGSVSAGDLLFGLLPQTGPVSVLVATWTGSPTEFGKLRQAIDRGLISSLRLLVDFSFPRRHPAYAADLRSRFGPGVVALTVCHAKLMILRNATWNLVVRSSANLNRNSRTEYHEVSDDPGLATFVWDTLAVWFPPAADTWDVPPSVHQRRFAEWGARRPETATAPATPGAPGASAAPIDVAHVGGLDAPTGAPAADAAFFSPDPWGVDLRRAGISFLR